MFWAKIPKAPEKIPQALLTCLQLFSCLHILTYSFHILNTPDFANTLGLHNARVADPVLPETIMGFSQKALSHSVDSLALSHLVSSLAGHDLARVQSLGLPGAGDWLNANPIKVLGLHLRDSELRILIRFRLGLPVFDREGPCVACGRDSDMAGIHAVGCGGDGQRISRHNILRDILLQTAQKALLAPTKEERFLLVII